MPDIKIAFPTDEHFPYQDENARNLALQIIKDFKPTDLVTGSDGLDFYTISSFDKDPIRAKEFNMQDEIEAWTVGQGEWRNAVGFATLHFLQGNHEERWKRYLWRHPEIAGMEALNLAHLLNLSELGFENGVEDEVNFADMLIVSHGTSVRPGSGNTARTELEKEKFAVSTLTGHTHRGGLVYVKTRYNIKQAAEGFCLCNYEAPYARGPMDWQHGITLATITKNVLSIEQIAFHQVDGKEVAQWRDKEYRNK
ncbi:MAG: hypothetical protein ABIL58_22355 [Pseudomonadota bacterium]